jgi:polyhydroxybutyrate depolymerase
MPDIARNPASLRNRSINKAPVYRAAVAACLIALSLAACGGRGLRNQAPAPPSAAPQAPAQTQAQSQVQTQVQTQTQTQTQAQEISGNVSSGGLLRSFTVHIPALADSAQLPPLVIALHGGGGTGAGMRQLSGLDAISNANGFVVAYPDGYLKSWADGRGTTDAEKAGVDDVAFISALIDQLAQITPIDTKRVYVTGISNGGMMSVRLACALSNKITGVAPVAANMPANLATNCRPTRPVPIMFVHGNADTFVPRDGGKLSKGAGGQVLSTTASVNFWLRANICPSLMTAVTVINPANDGTSINLSKYASCAAGGDVRFYDVINGGHTWPGSAQNPLQLIVGKVSQDMNTGRELWQFLSTFSLK